MKKKDACRSVSVVMSIYNEQESWLKMSIDSILHQTYSNFEFIIVNDNPQRTLNRNLIEHYQKLDERIIYIENHVNIGLTKSLNLAITVAKGDYIARMDADDYSFPTRLEKQITFLSKNCDVIAVGTWVNFFGDTNKKNKEYRTNKQEVDDFLMVYTPIAHPTVMIRKEAFVEHGIKYNEDYRFAQDYELFYQLSKVGKLCNIPEILLNYRTTRVQVSKQNNLQQRNLAISLRKKIIYERIGIDLVSQLGIFENNNTVKTFIKVKKYSHIVKKDQPVLYKSLQVLKYVLLMSPKRFSDRLLFFMLLIINPFQKIGFSFRYYLKALSNQLFIHYKSML